MTIIAADWSRRVQITEINTSPALSGYVALLTETNLPAEIWTTAINGGGDLRVCLNSDGTGQLPLEVVSFDTVGETAQLWVRFPTFASGDSLWLFYGKAGETQPAVTDTFGRNRAWVDYEVIIHEGTAVDSTGNHTPILGGSPSLGTGLIGQGYDLQLFSERITIPHSSPLSFGPSRNYSVDIWSNVPSSTGSTGQCLYDKAYTNNSGEARLFKQNSGNERHRTPDTSPSNLDAASAFGLTRTTYTFVGSSKRTIRNNSVIASATITNNISTNTDDVRIGVDSLSTNQYPLSGVISEVWVQFDSIRSDNTRSTEYANQSSPNTFWSTGTPEDTGGGGATYTLTFDPATFLLTGSDLNLAANRNASLDAGSYSYTGNDINIAANRNIIFDADSYSYIGNDIDLSAARNLSFDSGSYSYTGNDLTIRASRKVTLETGTYALTGNDLTLTYNQAGGATYTISLNAGSYLISGDDIQLAANRALLLDAGDYAYTGQPVILAANRVMSLEGGAYNLNGNDLNLIANRSITFNTGEYDVVGNPMTLTYSGQIISLMDTYSVNYTNEFVTASYSNNYITARFK